MCSSIHQFRRIDDLEGAVSRITGSTTIHVATHGFPSTITSKSPGRLKIEELLKDIQPSGDDHVRIPIVKKSARNKSLSALDWAALGVKIISFGHSSKGEPLDSQEAQASEVNSADETQPPSPTIEEKHEIKAIVSDPPIGVETSKFVPAGELNGERCGMDIKAFNQP
jgi:hypothetical protein